MTTFKGYSKEATSDTMMRIIKRERILSIIIAGHASGHVTLQRTNPTTEGLRRSEMPWHEANETTLQLSHPKAERDIFNWKLKLIQEGQWLEESNHKTWEQDGMLYASWSDTQKIRIFYNWLHQSKRYTIHRVLKYMYSPLFITMFYVDKVLQFDQDHGYVLTHGFHTKGKDSLLFQQWLKQVLDIDSAVLDDDSIAFYHESIQSSILTIEDEIKNTKKEAL